MNNKKEHVERIKELEEYQIVGMMEVDLLHDRFSQKDLKETLKNLFKIGHDDILVSDLCDGNKVMTGTDDYFNIWFADESLENDIYTIYVLPTNAKDKYYVTEIG